MSAVPAETTIPFQHRHAAHCESGAMAGLLRHYGYDISEPMAFGLASALIFVHLPWPKVGGFPLTAYRMLPGTIIKGLSRRLGIRMVMRRYRTADEGMADLDRQLAAGRVVGAQSSVYWLPYFPPDMRFHFNAHNMVIYGRRDNEYLISDPVFEHTVTCPAAALRQARFVKGVFAPKGLIYWPERITPPDDLRPVLRRAIRATAQRMLYAPLPFLGVSGIRLLARRLRRLEREDPRYARLFVNQIIRMQEEIGTGGAGFRFMYASFLQEASAQLQSDRLAELSRQMSEAGDEWRRFALLGAKMGRKGQAADYAALADTLSICAERETDVFRALRKI